MIVDVEARNIQGSYKLMSPFCASRPSSLLAVSPGDPPPSILADDNALVEEASELPSCTSSGMEKLIYCFVTSECRLL